MARPQFQQLAGCGDSWSRVSATAPGTSRENHRRRASLAERAAAFYPRCLAPSGVEEAARVPTGVESLDEGHGFPHYFTPTDRPRETYTIAKCAPGSGASPELIIADQLPGSARAHRRRRGAAPHCTTRQAASGCTTAAKRSDWESRPVKVLRLARLRVATAPSRASGDRRGARSNGATPVFSALAEGEASR